MTNIDQNQWLCVHREVFPLQPYPIFVYILLPFVVSICNIGGLSAGAFRILIFMNMLNYPVGKANSLIFIVITAAALANFFTIVPRRHPKVNAPLVDYNLVYIMMPTLIFGTNLGVFLNKLLIELVQDILVSLVLIFFFVVYLRKFIEDRKRIKLQTERQQLITESSQRFSGQQPQNPRHQSIQEQQKAVSLPIKQILITLLIFAVVQIMASITEGAFFHVKHCTLAYYLCFGGFIIVVAATVVFIYFMTKKTMVKYIKSGLNYKLELHQPKTFAKLVLSGLIAGLVQGLVGLGSCFVIIYILLTFNILPQVASAISGYIILFVGSASLIQELVVGGLEWKQTVFLFGITFVGSLIITFFARQLLKKKAEAADSLIVLILSAISVFSLVGVGASIILTIRNFGFHRLVTLPDFCS